MTITDPTPWPPCAWPACTAQGNHAWHGTHLCDSHWEGFMDGVGE